MHGIFIQTATNFYGPLKPADFRRYVKKGIVGRDDLIWHAQQGAWVRLGDLKDFSLYFERHSNGASHNKVIAIASGKGGVGKTAITASMAIELARAGKRVVVVDADFGGPDLHEWIGVKNPPLTLRAFFANSAVSLNDLAIDTGIHNIKIVCGELEGIESSSPKYFQRLRFVRHLHTLAADFVLVDLSPGVSYTTIDIFLNCDEGVVVTLPESTAFVDAFNFLKIALLRKLQKSLSFNQNAVDLLNRYETTNPFDNARSLRPLLINIERQDQQAAMIFKKILQYFRPKILMNMVMDEQESLEGSYFEHVIKNILLIQSEFVGYIDYRKDLRKVVKKARPLLLSQPKTAFSGSVKQNYQNFKKLFRQAWYAVNKTEDIRRQGPQVTDTIVRSPQPLPGQEQALKQKFHLQMPLSPFKVPA